MSKFRVDVKGVTGEGSPKKAKNQDGVKPDIFKNTAPRNLG